MARTTLNYAVTFWRVEMAAENRGYTGDMATDSWLTPKEAAGLLHVSRGYLRGSDCPKVLLPTQGKRSLVRYRRSEVEAWAEKHCVRSTMKLRRSA